ncbi:MAG: GNAT family N-acetyltransferase [Anaerolineales bacterium]|nr:GNAT family N-acetyltransferase [Anaerolineales bacterium]
MLHLHRFTEARKFLDLTSGFLAAHEAENNLIIGLAGLLHRNPAAYGASQPYFGAVSAGSQVVAASLMTPPNQAVLSWSEHEEAVRMLAGDVWTFRLDTPGVHGPRPTSVWFSEAWDTLTSLEPILNMAERAFRLERVVPVTGVPGSLRPVRDDELPLIADWSAAFEAEALARSVNPPHTAAEFLTLWRKTPATPPELGARMVWDVDGRPVSYAYYKAPTPNGMRIGPVYTPPEHRRHGYASALVAGVSSLILGLGKRYVYLYADTANPTSNHIYQAIGFEPICDVDEYRFGA